MGGSRKLLGLIVIGAAVIGTSSMAAAGKGGGAGSVNGHISVPDAVYGGMTTATVNPGGTDVYVYVQCYTPDFGGEYVYAAFFPVDANNQSQLGPLWSTLWPQGSASCQAQEGYFTRNGFGKWMPAATTTFRVNG